MNIRITLPFHLRTLARISDSEITMTMAPEPAVSAGGSVSLNDVLTAIEACYPMLRGTIRDHTTRMRRPFIRFYVAGIDWTHQSADAPLPDAVLRGEHPLMIIGAISGG